MDNNEFTNKNDEFLNNSNSNQSGTESSDFRNNEYHYSNNADTEGSQTYGTSSNSNNTQANSASDSGNNMYNSYNRDFSGASSASNANTSSNQSQNNSYVNGNYHYNYSENKYSSGYSGTNNNHSDNVYSGNTYSYYNNQPKNSRDNIYTGTYSTSNYDGLGKKVKKEKKPASKGFVVTVALVSAAFLIVIGLIGGSVIYKNKGSAVVSGSKVELSYDDTSATSQFETTDVTSVSEKVAKTVVEISTETVTYNQYFGQYVSEGAGSGVIISKDGYIITCDHVIEGATNVKVTLNDNTEYDAKIIGEDSLTDIAVLKIEGDEDFDYATFGDSSKLQVGQDVVAIGNPLGKLGGTVTTGIISALDRSVEIDGQKYTLLQTDAAINPGNSGGGLFDTEGNLIGVVNAKSSGTGIEGLGFAIPSNTATKISTQLISNGYISGRPKFGFTLFEIQDQQDYYNNQQYRKYISDYGVYIVSSESSDFKEGDRIIAVDDTTVSSIDDLKSLLNNYEVGDVVTVTISRIDESQNQKRMQQIKLTLTEKSDSSQN